MVGTCILCGRWHSTALLVDCEGPSDFHPSIPSDRCLHYKSYSVRTGANSVTRLDLSTPIRQIGIKTPFVRDSCNLRRDHDRELVCVCIT
jgi:hypothetical protein